MHKWCDSLLNHHDYRQVRLGDAGLYRVTIDNDLGREQATARLDVISECDGREYSIFYLLRCTLSDFLSVSSLASLPF